MVHSAGNYACSIEQPNSNLEDSNSPVKAYQNYHQNSSFSVFLIALPAIAVGMITDLNPGLHVWNVFQELLHSLPRYEFPAVDNPDRVEWHPSKCPRRCHHHHNLEIKLLFSTEDEFLQFWAYNRVRRVQARVK